MPDQSSADSERAILQEITAPLSTLPDDPLPIAADADFPVVLRGYDRLAVDAYVKRTSQLVAELHTTRSPDAAVRRALERVGEQISGILKRAQDTAAEITAESSREAEQRLEQARREAEQVTAAAQVRLRELDSETDRIWSERHRIVDDVRDLSRQLDELAQTAATRFPPADEVEAAGSQPHLVPADREFAPGENPDDTRELDALDDFPPGDEELEPGDAGGRLPGEGLPEDRLPEDRLPEDRLPDDRLPEDRLPEDRLPDDRLPDDRFPGEPDDPRRP